MGPGRVTSSVHTSFGHDVIVVLVIALAARLLFMALIPPAARSVDAHNWEQVANRLNAGENPYQTTTLLNWPPLWMQTIFVLSKIATALGIPFFRVLQAFLILVESMVMVLLIQLIRNVAPEARARGLAIAGMALNPAAILLVCQHCNFDVLVAFWLMLFMLGLLRYNRTSDGADWLWACLFLGLGILTKTVPLVLVPLLAGGFRVAAARSKFLGLALLWGPVTLGMSVIYVLDPAGITAKVLEYRSIGGAFGFPGLLVLAGQEQWAVYFNAAFYLLLFTAMTAISILFWHRRSIGDRETVLLAALLLMGIPALGPGYAPEYLYWFLPFLAATFAFFQAPWRRSLAAFAIIAAGTYLCEYAFLESHGAFFRKAAPHQWLWRMPFVYEFQPGTSQTLARLPLFAAYLALLVMGTGLLFRGLKGQSKRNLPVPEAPPSAPPKG